MFRHLMSPREPWALAHAILETAKQLPNQSAIADTDRELSYGMLAACARHLAARLIEQGVRPGDRVAILGDRNVDSVVAILATSLAGAAYVPLDVSQPPARLAFLLEDADVCGVIGIETSRSVGGRSPAARFFLPIAGVSNGTHDSAAPESRRFPEPDPASVAYVMYTSGSTGTPKGVQIEHRAIRAFFEAHNERLGMVAGDRCLSTGAFHFDVSLMDVFLPLSLGASVVLSQKLPVPSALLRTLQDRKITHFYAVGTLLALITGDGSRLDRYELRSLRALATGAEVCNVRVVNEWLSRYPALRFLNSYGPTEATVGCVSFVAPEPGPLRFAACPIGRPHTGTRVELLDDAGAPVQAAGEVGELVVAGPQSMRGYFRRPEEDAAVFRWLNGERYYRTGDYCYRDANGDLCFVGRRDDELKFRGFRVHLSEICRPLQEDPRVNAVLAGNVRGPAGEPELAAIVVTEATPSLALVRELERRAAALLPAPVVPERWALLRSLPTVSSGKADRELVLRQLGDAVREYGASAYVQTHDRFEPLRTS